MKKKILSQFGIYYDGLFLFRDRALLSQRASLSLFGSYSVRGYYVIIFVYATIHEFHIGADDEKERSRGPGRICMSGILFHLHFFTACCVRISALLNLY